jgi:hypothetical protein
MARSRVRERVHCMDATGTACSSVTGCLKQCVTPGASPSMVLQGADVIYHMGQDRSPVQHHNRDAAAAVRRSQILVVESLNIVPGSAKSFSVPSELVLCILQTPNIREAAFCCFCAFEGKLKTLRRLLYSAVSLAMSARTIGSSSTKRTVFARSARPTLLAVDIAIKEP